MASNRKLPDIAPCPDGHKRGQIERNRTTGLYSVWCCGCCWIGPGEVTKRAAILAWNRRASEPVDREKLMREGAMAALRWLRGWITAPDRACGFADVALSNAIERGEVIPAAKSEPWIVSNPGVMGGKPCVRGTRITVETLQAMARDGMPELRILAEYPSLTGDGLAAAMNYRLTKAQKRGRR